MSTEKKHKWLYSIAGVLAAAAVGLFLFAGASSGSDLPEMTVYKSASCGCCAEWVDHMEDAGFDVEVIEDRDLRAVKAEARVPQAVHSCHTAKVGGYVVEGHVPADDVKRMLRDSLPVHGIGVGGMPKGSPGMPGVPEPYAVQAFTADGETAVWVRH